MSHYIGPKCRLCRQEGEKLFLKGERCFTPKCSFQKKNYAPGIHGSKGSKLTEYGRQLREKQKIKRIYNLTEKKLLMYYKSSSKKGGDIGTQMQKLLEMRIDNIIYRSGLVSSRNTARQLTSHGHFDVNGKCVTVPSIQLKPGDKITLHKSTTAKSVAYQPSAEQQVPNWLKVDRKTKSLEVAEIATDEFIRSLNLNIRLVVEFYSR